MEELTPVALLLLIFIFWFAIAAALVSVERAGQPEQHNNWKPISELPIRNKCVVLIAETTMGSGMNYITDPWVGWRESEDSFARWPHPFPPTHFMELPDLKK